jgi:hypothetical protein
MMDFNKEKEEFYKGLAASICLPFIGNILSNVIIAIITIPSGLALR